MKSAHRWTAKVLSIPSIFCLFAVTSQAKQTTDVVVVGPDPLPVEIVPSPNGGAAACVGYDDSRYFQLQTIFQGASFRYDTLIRTDEPQDSFVITRVVASMVGEPGIASIVLSFNAPGEDIDPGLSITPPPSGNLGIDFAPSHSFAAGSFATATFEPDVVFPFSRSMGIRLVSTDGANLSAIQAKVQISGCLLGPAGP